MSKLRFVFILLVPLSIFSFLFIFKAEPVTFRNVACGESYSLAIPSYLDEVSGIDSGAIAGFSNDRENIVVLVYKKSNPADLSLKELFESVTNAHVTNMSTGKLIRYFPKQINGNQAFIGNIRGKVNNSELYYRIAIIATPVSFYQIVIGLPDDNRARFNQDFYQLIDSFAEVKLK